jgi:hypothetical protein
MADIQHNVMTPIKLESGKTIWQKVGVAYENDDPTKKHKMVISLVALPLGMPASTELKLFVYPQEEYRRQRQPPLPQPAYPDDDVNF